jgi:hypothetical protein
MPALVNLGRLDLSLMLDGPAPITVRAKRCAREQEY